ncbi:MAG: hypothetical protein WCG05_02550 [Alphaproteobacteria bacterium]
MRKIIFFGWSVLFFQGLWAADMAVPQRQGASSDIDFFHDQSILKSEGEPANTDRYNVLSDDLEVQTRPKFAAPAPLVGYSLDEPSQKTAVVNISSAAAISPSPREMPNIPQQQIPSVPVSGGGGSSSPELGWGIPVSAATPQQPPQMPQGHGISQAQGPAIMPQGALSWLTK